MLLGFKSKEAKKLWNLVPELFLFYAGYYPVEHEKSCETLNHPLCGCALIVIQKRVIPFTIVSVQVTIAKKGMTR